MKILKLMVLILALPAFASASGFAVLEQSGRGLGQSFAGATTGFGDGSSAFFNPAAMTELDEDLLHISNNLIIPNAEFRDSGSVQLGPTGSPIGPIVGTNGGDAGVVAYVPNVYYVKGFNKDKGKLGFAINSPFGLSSIYDSDWVGRYQAVKSELTTITLTPSAAYKITENLSVGAGLNVMYAEAELTNAIDFGTIGASQLGAAAANFGLSPQANDGFVDVSGNDWGVGYNFGLIYKLGNTTFGANYRSKVDLELRGNADFTVPDAAAILTSTGSFTDTGAVASPVLPETVGFDVTHNVSDKLQLNAGAIWTGWDRIRDLRIEFGSTQPDNVVDLDWNSTWRYALGASYEVCDKLRMRIGGSYEQTPIDGAEFRTARIPDDDRIWLNIGGTYNVTEDIEVDLSYAHVFLQEGSINTIGSTGDMLNGDFNDLALDILALSFTWRM